MSECGRNETIEGDLRLTYAKFRSPLDLEAAVYALRMVESLDWHSRLLRGNQIVDYDILSLLGFDVDDSQGSRITLTRFRCELAGQLVRLERRLRQRTDNVKRNIAAMRRTLGLNKSEVAILRFAVIATRTRHFDEFFHRCLSASGDVMLAVHLATKRPLKEVKIALGANAILRQVGYLRPADRMNPMGLDSATTEALLATRFDEKEFLRWLVRPAPLPNVDVANFISVAELATAHRYIGKAADHRSIGVNVLLYGAPGTGKTQFVRALAADLKLDLFEVPNEDKDGAPLSGLRRFGSYKIAQHVLAHNTRNLLLFDEVEDVFRPPDSSKDMDVGGAYKCWINEQLETNQVPAIWVCNSIRAMDHAFLRRFDLVIEVSAPSCRIRRGAIDRYFSGDISEDCAKRLAAVEQLAPAQIERTARVVRSLESTNIEARDAAAECILGSTLRAMGKRARIQASVLPGHYDPSLLNSNCDLASLTTGLSKNGSGRLCLYGPPGTGKTAFAHHLGVVLDRPVLVRRGSDLLSMWVGGTEELIAEAFRRAREDGAILVIDEADGFLRDRERAERGWEVTQVNELLTQMESFDGIFVASTNLIDTLDAASLRRFDFKIKFDYLTRGQRRAMLQRVCNSSTGMESAVDRLDRIEYVTPGDFANVLRQLQVTGDVPQAEKLVALLSAEAAMKPEQRQRRGIGFTAG